MSFAIKNVKIVTPFRVIDPGFLLVAGKKILALGTMTDAPIPSDVPSYDGRGLLLTPGFIDLLVHGGGGAGFADEQDSSMTIVSDYFFKHGTTGILASLYSKPIDQLKKDVNRIVEFSAGHPDTNIWGIHMEGPFINPKIKGAHKIEYLWKPNVDMWNDLYAASHGSIKIMTIAPELTGCFEVMRSAAGNDVVLSIGHSLALYPEIEKAIDNGAAHVTHMFNAMRPFHHREAGVMVAALLKTELKLELIADAVHVHPMVMKLLYTVKGSNGIILITDAICASGMPEGKYHFMDQDIVVKDKRAFLPNGTLAGSTLTMEAAVKNMVELVGVPLPDAIRMASLNGAKVLGLEHKKGILSVGKDADFVLLNDQFEVQATVYEGQIKYQRDNILYA